MDIDRREFMLMAGGATLATALPTRAGSIGDQKMYGLISKMTAVPEQRDALITILLDGLRDMPGCLSYVVAKDPEDANALWVTEVWDSQKNHQASLTLPSVQQAMAKGKPLIAGIGLRVVTEPVGGHGLG